MARENDTIPISSADSLQLPADPGLESLGGGVFICPGSGRHAHRTMASWELILVERGRLGIAVGSHEHDLQPGAWILMPAGVPHRGTRDYPRDLRFLWIHFHPRAGGAGEDTLALPLHGQLKDPGRVSALLRRLIDHHASLHSDRLVADLMLALALAELRAMPQQAEVGDELAARALRVIQVRFRERLSTAGVARALGVSADHLGRCFKRAHGMAVLDAINRQRLNEASRLLLLGGGSIGDVAASAGFPQTQWFRRLFERQHGIGPRQWRRLHARVHTNTA